MIIDRDCCGWGDFVKLGRERPVGSQLVLARRSDQQAVASELLPVTTDK